MLVSFMVIKIMTNYFLWATWKKIRFFSSSNKKRDRSHVNPISAAVNSKRGLFNPPMAHAPEKKRFLLLAPKGSKEQRYKAPEGAGHYHRAVGSSEESKLWVSRALEETHKKQGKTEEEHGTHHGLAGLCCRKKVAQVVQ